MRRVLALLLVLPLLATQSCMQPEEGDVDTLYVYRKDTVYHRDTLIAKVAVETLSIDLFTYFYRYDIGYRGPDSNFWLSPEAEKQIQNLDDRIIPRDSIWSTIIKYAEVPKAFYAQVRIDSMETGETTQCTTFVDDTLQAKPDSVHCWRGKTDLDTSRGYAFSYKAHPWQWATEKELPGNKYIPLTYKRWIDRGVTKIDQEARGAITIPEIEYISGKGFIISSWWSNESYGYGVKGRIVIVVQK